VTLDGSQSKDPDGTTLSYQWVQRSGPTVQLSNSGSVAPTFTTPTGLTQNQTLAFELEVTDGHFTTVPDAVSIIIQVNNPVPTTTGISPPAVNAGNPGGILVVTGTNFVSGSTVLWNGSSRTTTYVSSTQLNAAIPASDLTTAGTAQVTVFNPTPGGGTSNAQTFTIQ